MVGLTAKTHTSFNPVPVSLEVVPQCPVIRLTPTSCGAKVDISEGAVQRGVFRLKLAGCVAPDRCRALQQNTRHLHPSAVAGA